MPSPSQYSSVKSPSKWAVCMCGQKKWAPDSATPRATASAMAMFFRRWYSVGARNGPMT